ncbi:MAG TPA: hypothetical protein VF725_13345 [Ktedonobacterales bacterium]
MQDALGWLGSLAVFLGVIVLPIVAILWLFARYARWAERHGIQIGATEDDDDDDDSPFDSWWQAPPPTFRP